MKDQRVKGYPFDEVRHKEELILRTYEYDMPFNYPNVTMWRKHQWGEEFHGVELKAYNQASPSAQFRGVDPGRWTRIQTIFMVPPEAVSAVFLINVAGMAADETLWISDAFAGVVPDDWDEYDDIPAGAINLLANPAFAGGQVPPAGWRVDAPGPGLVAGGFIPPAGWKTDLSKVGEITPEATVENGHAGLRLRGATATVYAEFPVQPGQRLVYSLWAKSTNRLSKSLSLSPCWKSREGLTLSDVAADCIIIEEDEPIVRVAVIGSACTPSGYVLLEAEPTEEFYHRGDMVRCTAPVRFKQSNLWGMHLRVDQWRTFVQGDFGYEDIPEDFLKVTPILRDASVKSHYSEFPFTGMSCAVFEIPKSRKVTVMGGSEAPAWLSDSCPNDDHYSFRTIRTTIASKGRV